MSRIAGRFQQLASEGRKALIPYIVVGDPTLKVTVPLMHSLVEHGADIIELGVPFSEEDGQLHLTREGGHSARRIVHVTDATGAAVYLESTNPRNVGFYQRLGFDIVSEFHPEGGPLLTGMWREPVS